MIIFQDLDFPELLAVAKLHPHHRYVAEIVFNEKSAYKILSINNNGLNIKSDDGNYKNFADFQNIGSALEIFGHLITLLTIDYGKINIVQCNVLNEQVSKYLANSLIELQFTHFTDENLEGLQTFNKVEVVRLLYCASESKSQINMLKLFPNLRRFDVSNLRYLSFEQIEHHFPHLGEIIERETGHITIPQLERLFELNPQIENLTVLRRDLNGLKEISTQLTNLKRIRVDNLDLHPQLEKDIKFEHVTSLDITFDRVPQNFERIPIAFGNLVEIKCHRPLDQCFDIIIHNRKLKRIISSELSDEKLQQLAEELPNLEEIYLRKGNTNDAIVQFIETGEKLQQIHLSGYEAVDCSDIRDRLQDLWTVDEVNVYQVIFTKIQ